MRSADDARTVLITGASSGIGRATAQMFTRQGFRVFGTSRHPHASQDDVHMLRLDVQSDHSVDRCVAEVLSCVGRIDVLVNNAGVMHEGFVEETTIEQAQQLLSTNLFGAARMINAVLPGMRQRRSGRVITVGSLASWVGEPGEGFYAASKAALARYTEALRYEVWALGIAVSLVEPGAFATNVLDSASVGPETIGDYDRYRAAARRALHESLRRGGDPRDWLPSS